MTWEKHPSPLMSSHGGVAQFAAIRRNSRVISEIKTRSNEITPDEMSSQVHHTTHRTHPKHMGTGSTHHSKALLLGYPTGILVFFACTLSCTRVGVWRLQDPCKFISTCMDVG